MWRFTLFDFPVVVHWQFWLSVILLGGGLDVGGMRGLQLLMLWAGVVFVSILGHELGHAFAMRHFGDRHPDISLYAFGGMAQGRYGRTRSQQVVVSAAGPAASFALALLGMVVEGVFFPNGLAAAGLAMWWHVNFGWTLLNLLPVLPLDGGRISEALFGPRRARQACMLSFVSALLMALYSLGRFGLFTAVFFGMLAYNSWQRLNGRTPDSWMRP